MLIQTILEDMKTAMRAGDPVRKTLLSTLYSEAAMVGKNKRNSDSTDDEVIAVVKKFVANAEETLKVLNDRNMPNAAVQAEILVLSNYLPRQMDRAELEAAVRNIVTDKALSGPKAMGQVMAELKARHSGTYDGKMASDVVKSVLS